MRIGGLASGMDTDTMVKEMMKAESMKVDRVKADKQILEWKKESLNSLNKDFANFILDSKKDFGYNAVGRPGSMDWIKSATSSDETKGTATAGKGAFGGKHDVNVTKLATGVSGTTKAGETVNEVNWEKKAFDFEINGKKVSITDKDSLETIAKKINSSGAGVQASFDDKLGKFFIRTEKEGTEAKINFTPIVDKDSNKAGLENFLSTIQVELTGINATTDPNNKVITKQDLASDMKLTGANGIVDYNGLTGIEITSNQFEFNGVKFDAKTEGAFSVTVSNNEEKIVEQVMKFVDDYNKMLEKAGTLLKEKSNKNYRPLTPEQREAMSEKDIENWEKKAKSGLIRDDMDVQRMLSDLRSDLYKEVEGATGAFKNITQIGITTQGYKPGGAGGMLQVDEKKLREAIAKDADGVMEMLFKEDPDNAIANDDDLAKLKTTDTKDKEINQLTAKRNKSGLVTRIFDNLAQGMKSLIGKSGPGADTELFRKVKSTMMTDFVKRGGRYSGRGSVSDIDDDMMKFTKRIDNMNVSLFKKENAFFAKFAAMESAMQKATAQSGWLMQQM